MVSKTNIFHGDFPGSSAGKESACNAGDPSSIPGSGRSSEEWIGYPFQNSSAFLVAQIVKNHCSERDLGSISGLGKEIQDFYQLVGIKGRWGKRKIISEFLYKKKIWKNCI